MSSGARSETFEYIKVYTTGNERMIPLSPLLVALLCLPTCGCGVVEAAATEVITEPISQSMLNESREHEATERCEKKHPGVPDECPKWDMECQARVEDFNKCVDREAKELPFESEAIERCKEKHPEVPDQCPKGDKGCQMNVDYFNRCVRREARKLSEEE